MTTLAEWQYRSELADLARNLLVDLQRPDGDLLDLAERTRQRATLIVEDMRRERQATDPVSVAALL